MTGDEPISMKNLATALGVDDVPTCDKPVSVDNLKAVLESNKTLDSAYWSGNTETGMHNNYQEFNYQIGNAASGINSYFKSATAITVKERGRYRLFVGCMNTSTMAFSNCSYSLSASVSGGETYSLGGYGVVPALQMVEHSAIIEVPADSTRVDITMKTVGDYTNVGLLSIAVQKLM